MTDEFLDGFCGYLSKIKTTGHMFVAAALFAAAGSLLSLASAQIALLNVSSPILPFVKVLAYIMPFMLVFVTSFLLIRGFARLHSKNEYLFEVAERDDLTRLVNRAGFLRRGEKLVQLAERDMSSLSVIMLDVDHFKSINDTSGHTAGDMALKHLADILRRTCRAGDVVARWGGEEFAIIMPLANAQGAAILAERLREDVAQSPLYWNHKTVQLTISAGVTEWRHHEDSFEALIERSDQGLYLAKNEGRNHVHLLRSHLETVAGYEQDVCFDEQPDCAPMKSEVAA
nr:GGDEF domain-containing protein [uncultured Cohaesibacter sp.]